MTTIIITSVYQTYIMVLLHISAKASATASHKFRVELPHKIISQVFTIKKSIIVQQYNASGANTNHIAYLNVPWISMYEATNNNSQPWLPLSFDPSQSRTESDYHIRIKAEELPMAFDIELYKDADGTPFQFQSGTNNQLQSVDLFFEYETNQSFV